jgi:hypothetical protein
MSVMDGGQPRPDVNDPGSDDRKNTTSRPKRIRKPDPDHYAKWGKAHYEKNKAAYVARSDERKKQGRAEFAAFKARLACAQCGENHPATLDFHHVVRKPGNRKVHRLVANGQYEAAMKEAMEKCIVLCANCHRKHHYEEDQIKRGPKPPSINQEG